MRNSYRGDEPGAPAPGRPGQLRVLPSPDEVATDTQFPPQSDLGPGGRPDDQERVLTLPFALEMMAQAAVRLHAAGPAPAFENVHFQSPVTASTGRPVTLRVAAVRRDGRFEVALRSSATRFQLDHVRATLRYAECPPAPLGLRRRLTPGPHLVPAAEPCRYLMGYRQLSARSCLAEISTSAGHRGPAEPVLGDAGVREAFIRAIGGCVPQAQLRPVAVHRIYPARSFADAVTGDARKVIVSATERHRQAGIYIYDVDVFAPCGKLIERWEGLRLEAGPDAGCGGPWAPVLLGPYLERQFATVLPGRLSCVVEPVPETQEARCTQVKAAVARMLGRPALVWFRADGQPELAEEGITTAVAQHAGMMMAVLGATRVLCDVRGVCHRTMAEWRLLLGGPGLALAAQLQRDRREPLRMTATRVWGVLECLRQAGQDGTTALTVIASSPEGWVEFGIGPTRIATFQTHLRDQPQPHSFSIMTSPAAVRAD